jgi:hypothetical protein
LSEGVSNSFQYTQSAPKSEQCFNLAKLILKQVEKKPQMVKNKFTFRSRFAMSDIPLTHLYNTSPNNITKETIIQGITFREK